jgi:hypothetical protein
MYRIAWIMMGMALSAAAAAAPIGTAFTYQGQLRDGGLPAQGLYDLQFALYDASSGPSQVGPTLTLPGVSVAAGLFAAQLDFGQVYTGQALYLAIGVRPGGSGGAYTALTPRQPLKPAPYALYAPGGLWQASGSNVYYSAGNVGIGTTAPEEKLHVAGNAVVRGSGWPTPGSESRLFLGDGNQYIKSVAGQGLRLGTYGGTDGLVLKEGSGNVGIGTISPQGALHVASAGDPPQLKLEQTASNWARLRMGATGGTMWDVSVGPGATPALSFWNGSANTMVLAYNGNVGIGTTVPQQKLNVVGIAQFDLPTGRVSVSTPGGNPGVIAFAPAGHRRDIVFDDVGLRLLVGNSASAPTVGLDIYENGHTRVQVLEIAGGSDLSEPFDVNSQDKPVQPGMVVCIDAKHPGRLIRSSRAYDRTVAGILSGAGGVNPGLVMGQKGSAADGAHPVALSGRVYCLVDASGGAVEPGDLLTTSDTPGHAMKVRDPARAQGAVLGKAMSSLAAGRKGLVLVLVTLQ